MKTAFKRIAITKTARYFISGTISEKTKTIWIVLHGYSQLAGEFIGYFNPLSSESAFIIAPEALNKFYVKGFEGRVGATWMTREDRESEIIDYVGYLDSVYDEVIRYGLLGSVKINVLGFSQGTAAACRWITKGKSKIDRLILWGGGIPQDVDLITHRELLNSIELTFILGDKDEFVPEEQLIKQIDLLTGNEIKYKVLRYTGKHEINSAVLRQLI